MLETKAEVQDGMLRINMGPQHPATHGVINFMVETDGEVMARAIPDVGYLHRGIEKIAEMTPWPGFIPYTDRVDYLAAMFANQAYVMSVEQLFGVEVPPRAEYLRVLACELNRIASHLVATGCMAMDLGAFTPFVHWLRERETINDLMELICGARLTYNYMRIGGVARNLHPDIPERTSRWLDHFVPMIDEFNRLISGNEIFVRRLANVATVSADMAITWGLGGPNLRASGVDWDLRRDEPYSVYPDFEFDVPLGQAFKGSVGDSYDRFVVRVLEIRESVKIIRQVLDKMPDGDFQAKVSPKTMKKPPAGDAYGRVESARGELGYYSISDGTDKPFRVKIRTGSFTACGSVEAMSPGLMIADLVALIGSLDIVAPEIDR